MLPALSPTQTVSLNVADQRHPMLLVDAGQRGQLQHADGLPTQVDHGVLGVAADELPSLHSRADHRMPVLRSGDAQRGGLGDRLAKELDERVADADVRHTPGGEKKLQGVSWM